MNLESVKTSVGGEQVGFATNGKVYFFVDKIQDGVETVTITLEKGFSLSTSFKAMQKALWDAIHESGFLIGRQYEPIRFKIESPFGASKVRISMEVVWTAVAECVEV